MKEDLEINSRLRLLSCLSGLSNKELDIITEHAETRKVPKNNILFTASDPVKFFFILEKGIIKAYKASTKGKVYTMEDIKVDGTGTSNHPYRHTRRINNSPL